ncbi:MAG: roadblock/LC7 domain-containing protein [Candidatus Hodarchaeota archaeon]
MSNDKLNNILDRMLQGIPGIICVLMIDQDGNLFYKNGRFDVLPNELGAAIAVNLSVIKMAGKLLKQEMNTVLTEFNKMKIYQIQIGTQYFLILLLKIKDNYFGEVRIKINKVVEKIHENIFTIG